VPEGRRRPVVIGIIAVVVAIVAGTVVFGVTSGSSKKHVPKGDLHGYAPNSLTVNGAIAPVGVDPDAVSFAWHIGDPRTGVRQTGYRILVSRSKDPQPGSVGVVWDHTVRSAQQAFVPYAGPRLAADTQYWWTVQTPTASPSNADRGATDFASSRPFVTGLRDADWKAQWVRPGPAQPGPFEYTYVRKDARISASPIVRATAYVAAAHQYQLFIDGAKVAAGPSYSYPDEQYYEATDVTRALRAGAENAIGVLHFWSGPGQGRPASAPGLLVHVTVLHEDGTREVIGTDGTWREHAAEWLAAPPRNDEGGFTEHVDGRLQPRGWDEPGFAAAGWTPVAVLGPPGTSPFTHLVAQRTHIVEHPAVPVSVKTLPSGAVVADYGEIIAARPAVTFHNGVAGRTIAMHAGFVLDPDGSVSTTRSTQATDMSFSYIERAGAQTFDAYTYLGFRYLEIDAPGETLSTAALTAHARHAGMPDENAATFSSSDPTLDKVWALVRRTALYVSQEQFVDTPTREKGQFLGDSFNDSQATMHAFGEQNLTWQALEDFAHSQARYWPDGNLNAVYPNGDGKRSILDYTERYPEWLWEYYVQTGDLATLKQLYPVAVGVTTYLTSLQDRGTGLVTYTATDGADLVDWPPAMQYGYETSTVAHTTANVLAVDAFRRTAQMARVLGKVGDAAGQDAHAEMLTTMINSKLTRPDGIYVDGLAADGTPSSHASQQANEFPLAFDVVPKKNVAAVGRYVASLGIKTGPFDGLMLLDGLHAAGLDNDVVRVLTDTKDPGWANIAANGGSFVWESWILIDAEGDGMSHGWGSSALLAFQHTLLGVTEAAPGPTPGGPVLDVRAPSSGPDDVSGYVPTIAGRYLVRWQRSGKELTLDLQVPPNGTAHVDVPGATPTTKTVGAGKYHFVRRAN
jgi:alpha-L-rhamnosidase